jgi:hypothetical protein
MIQLEELDMSGCARLDPFNWIPACECYALRKLVVIHHACIACLRAWISGGPYGWNICKKLVETGSQKAAEHVKANITRVMTCCQKGMC